MSNTSIELRDHRSDASPASSIRHDSEDNINVRVVAAQSTDATIPDGGYGWVVVFCCAIIAFWFVGTSYSWGVIQKKLVQEHVASASTLSFVGGLAPMCIAVFAILNARLLMSIGARTTCLIGISLVGLGGVFASFAPKSVPGLFVCCGVIEGIGNR
jgi:cyanate permease